MQDRSPVTFQGFDLNPNMPSSLAIVVQDVQMETKHERPACVKVLMRQVVSFTRHPRLSLILGLSERAACPNVPIALAVWEI